MKKNIIITLLTVFALGACQAPEVEEGPLGLEEKRALLVTKRVEFQTLTNEIEQLESEIQSLDPNAVGNKKLVTTLPVMKKNFERFAEMQGSVETMETADAAPEVPGRILKTFFKEGDRIRAGQLVAKLDLEQLNKQLAELDKTLELAQDVFARQERLWKQNIGSELQYLEAKNNVERLEKSKETLDYQMTKAEVYAPISGVVDQVMLEAGELAMMGAPILKILSTNRLKVVADLPEQFLQNVRRGDQVMINYPALAMEQSARISLIGSTIDVSNRTFKVEMNVGNPKGQLKPNLSATVKVKEYEEKDVVVIPIDLVQQEVGGKKFVITVETKEGESVAKKVYVNTGETYDGEVVITDGLSEGGVLVEKGARGLVDSEAIEIQNTKTDANNG